MDLRPKNGADDEPRKASERGEAWGLVDRCLEAGHQALILLPPQEVGLLHFVPGGDDLLDDVGVFAVGRLEAGEGQ